MTPRPRKAILAMSNLKLLPAPTGRKASIAKTITLKVQVAAIRTSQELSRTVGFDVKCLDGVATSHVEAVIRGTPENKVRAVLKV